jgi:NADPH:quinone reductase-like Zn-dependent oxidoreductase
MQLQTGQKVLIHGGAGGIGSLAIQIAKSLGAYVTTTASARDTDFVKALGADTVIDYQAEDFTKVVHDYDAVYDTVGGDTAIASYAVLKSGGRLVSMVEPVNEALATEHGVTAIYQFTKVTTEHLTHIAELVDSGRLTVNLDKVFPLSQAGEALEYLKTTHPRGKVVIHVAE